MWGWDITRRLIELIERDIDMFGKMKLSNLIVVFVMSLASAVHADTFTYSFASKL
jgi:hypothetical protein